MSGIFRYVESLVVREVLDYASYDNAFMLFDVMGFGRAPDSKDVIGADPALLGSVFTAPLMLVAEGLGADDREVHVRPPGHGRRRSVRRRGRPDRGGDRRGAALLGDRGGGRATGAHRRARHPAAPGGGARLAGRARLERHRGGAALDGPRGEHRRARGGRERPGLPRAPRCTPCTPIAPVCRAAPGIKTFLDLPTIVGRHALRRPATLRSR